MVDNRIFEVCDWLDIFLSRADMTDNEQRISDSYEVILEYIREKREIRCESRHARYDPACARCIIDRLIGDTDSIPQLAAHLMTTEDVLRYQLKRSFPKDTLSIDDMVLFFKTNTFLFEALMDLMDQEKNEIL